MGWAVRKKKMSKLSGRQQWVFGVGSAGYSLFTSHHNREAVEVFLFPSDVPPPRACDVRLASVFLYPLRVHPVVQVSG